MRLYALVLFPSLVAAMLWGVRSLRNRSVWLLGAAAVHAALVISLWADAPADTLSGWLAVDAPGLLVLTLVSALFLATSVYTVGYLRRERTRGGRAFVSCLLAFLAAMTLVTLSQHLALLWVGLEATTLAAAPLVYHRRDRRSLEAVWKYLLVSSVGIALALLGIFFLATAQAPAPGRALILSDLVAHATLLHPAWLQAAFIFLLVGFGTKMGLAPMHLWKPDTYGEAPSLVSGLMAGALTSCAFLGVVRITQVVIAAGLAPFARPLLIGFGLLSLAVAAAFIVGQSDIKRALAYSSVEHMGLLVLGLGLGGVGAYGSMLHVLNNGLAKTLLFLAAGNAALLTGSSSTADNRGLLRSAPITGVLLLAGFLAISGTPPFGPFLSELTILGAAVAGGHLWVAIATLALLAVIFVGMAIMFVEVAYGGAPRAEPRQRESGWLVGAPIALALLVLALGLYLPMPLRDALGRAAVSLGGSAP